jgi:adenylate cyclase class IV|uniref:CYTH domain-containing protein n=1 Tax=viral metagenome TaxID=1070528 RepID=A0A6C0GZI0_9ZZZZ
MEEIEGKFLNININDLRKKLKLNNAKKIHKMMLYKRYVFHLLSGEKGYIRTRQENKKVTITVKKYPKDSKFATESEVVIDGTLEQSRDFLLAQGYKLKAYQETLREKWSLGDCLEIAIDSVPGIPSYVELECKSEKEIKRVAKLLDLDYSKIEYGAYDKQFVDYYGMLKEDINNAIASLTFKNIDKELKNYIKKNNELLKQTKKDHLELITKNKIK